VANRTVDIIAAQPRHSAGDATSRRSERKCALILRLPHRTPDQTTDSPPLLAPDGHRQASAGKTYREVIGSQDQDPVSAPAALLSAGLTTKFVIGAQTFTADATAHQSPNGRRGPRADVAGPATVSPRVTVCRPVTDRCSLQHRVLNACSARQPLIPRSGRHAARSRLRGVLRYGSGGGSR
jgi:hypothetical protein